MQGCGVETSYATKVFFTSKKLVIALGSLSNTVAYVCFLDQTHRRQAPSM